MDRLEAAELAQFRRRRQAALLFEEEIEMASDLEQELERAIRLRGYRYGIHDFTAHLKGVDVLRAENDHFEANYLKKGLLDRKMKELFIVLTCVAKEDKLSHIQVHMHAAHKAGASPEFILEMIEFVAPWIGSGAKLAGQEAWRVTFRPDLPSIDQVVELR
jgi:alkylhydroperoxidase/carboxymuconolactone decarboxylase family protein YurZ